MTLRTQPTPRLVAHGLALLCTWALGLFAANAQAVTLTFACGASASDQAFCIKYANLWAEKHGHTIKTFSVSQNGTETLSLLRQMFAAKSTDVDVIMMDVVWPGVIKKHLLDLKPYSQGQESEHFPAMVKNVTIDGKLLGMPWYADAGLLYYRKDLLQKYQKPLPKTWDALIETAKWIQTQERAAGRDFSGYVFQGKAYEGLTTNALEWVSAYGAEIVNETGEIKVNSPEMIAGWRMARRLVSEVSPRGALNYHEEDSRGVFQNGSALFMRNWPYAWALLNKPDSPVRDRVGITTLPAGPAGHSAAALGGWNLGVSAYSKHPKEAAELVMFMTSAMVQKERAIGASFNPTRPDLYDDPDLVRSNPFMAQLKGVFNVAVPRPSTVTGPSYPRVSQRFWDATHDALSGKLPPEEVARRLEGQLKQVKRKGW